MERQCGYRRRWPDGARFLQAATTWEECNSGKVAIGHGNYGLVCYAIALGTGDYVAIKIPKAPEKEIALPDLSQITHVLPVRDRCGPERYEVMDLVGLGNLEGLIKLLGTLQDPAFRDQVYNVVNQDLIEGLAQCHAMRLYHLDFKADNVMVTDRGELKIADFGEAQHSDTGRVQVGDGGGKEEVRPPEAFLFDGAGACSGEAMDSWALGLTLAELTGRPLARDLADIVMEQTACRPIRMGRFEQRIKSCVEGKILTLPRSPITSVVCRSVWSIPAPTCANIRR